MRKSQLTTLKTEQEFNQFRHSRTFHSNSFRLRFTSRPNQNNPRFGFIVSKKIFPKVTKRNQVKRRLKRIVQLNLSNTKPADILLTVKNEAGGKRYRDLEQELLNLFKQAYLWKKF
ncbi:MAG: ribonuclease P protein component [Candidatus Doudnabacteria bacterium]|nr:ribonuclease P protein component [Candidatus Doudnabacteria bacterium]